MGGDEVNRPEAGKNYGWPVITYGIDYSGAKIGVGTEAAGLRAAAVLLGPVHRAVRAWPSMRAKCSRNGRATCWSAR